MTIKVGINGMGRIGRMVIRAIIESQNKNIEIKHINNRSNSEASCALIKYDSLVFLVRYLDRDQKLYHTFSYLSIAESGRITNYFHLFCQEFSDISLRTLCKPLILLANLMPN